MPAINHHPDVYTPEEAKEYLRFPSLDTLEWAAEKHHLKGFFVGREKRYHRVELDLVLLKMAGLQPGAAEIRAMKIAGGAR